MIRRNGPVRGTQALVPGGARDHIFGMPDHQQPTAPILIPLSPADRVRVLARLQLLPPEVKGDDLDRLIDYVEIAHQPVDDRYKPLGRSAAAVAASEPDADDLAALLPALIKAAKQMTASPAWSHRGEGAEDSGRQTRRRMVDPFAGALARFVVRDAAGVRMHRTRALRQAIDLLAALPDTPATSPAGQPYDRRGASGLVRAVCLYAHENGFFQREWPSSRRADAIPTRTAELIVATADAFGVVATNSELRTNLRNYATELNALDRTAPVEADLYGRLFDNIPKQRSRATQPIPRL